MATQTAFRLKEDVKAMLETAAKDGRPMSWHVDKALREYFTPTKAKAVKEPSKRFSPPDYEQAANYFYEKGSKTCQDDARAFIDFYESKGWYVGKNKMKDWRAAVRNWIKRSEERATSEKSKQSLSQRSANATERALAQIEEVGGDLLGSHDAPLRLQMDQ